jgi:hypothetical protein
MVVSMPPSVWGPFFWHTMHLVALGYPNAPSYQEKKAAKEFYESFAFLIPCPICKTHYEEKLKEMPLTVSLDSRKDLFRWTVEIHNKVNAMLQKPTLTESDALDYYTKLGAYGRSPVWTPEDFQNVQYESYLKGAGVSFLLFGTIGLGLWWMTKNE